MMGEKYNRAVGVEFLLTLDGVGHTGFLKRVADKFGFSSTKKCYGVIYNGLWYLYDSEKSSSASIIFPLCESKSFDFQSISVTTRSNCNNRQTGIKCTDRQNRSVECFRENNQWGFTIQCDWNKNAKKSVFMVGSQHEMMSWVDALNNEKMSSSPVNAEDDENEDDPNYDTVMVTSRSMEEFPDPNYVKIVEVNSSMGRTPSTRTQPPPVSPKKPMTLPNRAKPTPFVAKSSSTPPVGRKKSLSVCNAAPETTGAATSPNAKHAPVPQPRVRKPTPNLPLAKTNSLCDMRIDKQSLENMLNNTLKPNGHRQSVDNLHKKPAPMVSTKPRNMSTKGGGSIVEVKSPQKPDVQRRKIVEEKKRYEVMEDDIDSKKEKRLPHVVDEDGYLSLHDLEKAQNTTDNTDSVYMNQGQVIACTITEKILPESIYQLHLDRTTATSLLLEKGTPGLYLIRSGKENKRVLSAFLLNDVRHYILYEEEGHLYLKKEEPHFKKLFDIIKYYRENNLPTCHARLEQPYR